MLLEVLSCKNQLRKLLESTSEQEFDSTLNEMMSCNEWNQKISKHFSDMAPELKAHACRYLLEKAGWYKPGSGITTNPAEGYNHTNNNRYEP